jgi:predicted CoA-binding protein
MTTTSTKSVAARLAVRPGHSVYVVNPPARYTEILGRLPAGAHLAGKNQRPADRVVLFAGNHAELESHLPEAIAATDPDGALWVAYPKIASGKSDLSRQDVHDAIRLAGWKPVSQISMDDTWSAIRARPQS